MRCLWFVLLVGVILEYRPTNSQELPAEIKMCRFSDSACLVETVQNVLSTFAHTGLRHLQIPPFDPLRISLLKLERNPSSPVSVELKFKDVDLVGLREAKVEKISGFARDLKGITEIGVFAPKLTLTGPYAVDGSVLILPIVGHGNSVISIENVHITIKLKLKAVQKGDKTFLEVDAVKIALTPKKVSFKLENLFNGNKALGDNMNVFINENWKEIYEELEPAINRALGLIVKHILNHAFAGYPYEDYFLKD